MTVACDAALVAQRFRDRLPKRDAAILHRVMLIDMKIAVCMKRDIDARMPRKLLQHVIEETNTGGDRKSAGPIEVDLDGDRGLFCFPFDSRFSQGSALACRSRFLTVPRRFPYPTP